METSISATSSAWSSTKVLTLAVICLLVGVVVGALFHGSAQSAQVPVAGIASASQAPVNPSHMDPQALAALHQGVPSAADPVFQKLKSDPNNLELLAKAATISMQTNDAKSAVQYYGRSLTLKEDPEVRLNLGNAFAYSGEPDLALKEFATVLKANPKNDKALFNTGMIRLRNKNDPKGAINAWETLLKDYPNHPHRDVVQKMIESAKKPVPKA